jgi:acetyl-CoA carboxylase carboxyl transferase subunit beta
MPSWFQRIRTQRPVGPDTTSTGEKTVKTEGLFVKCPGCDHTFYKKDFEENKRVCPDCGHHLRVGGRERLAILLDDEEWQELDAGLVSSDPLHFEDTKKYSDRLADLRKRTGLDDAVVSVLGKLDGRRIVAAAMDLEFVGGSMGSVVGERIARAIERAIVDRIPIIIFSASGGARMQEGTLSLMQMAKISAALARLDEERIPYISVLTDPTTGGVTASFAMLGDLNIAEPGALIGFAGPRVIEQTIRQKLPEGFQRAEFLLEHGMLDAVVPRTEMREYLIRALAALAQ